LRTDGAVNVLHQTLRIHEGRGDARQRLECGDFSTAFVRPTVSGHSMACGAHQSGGERAALQALRVHERLGDSGQRLGGPWQAKRDTVFVRPVRPCRVIQFLPRTNWEFNLRA